MSATKHNSNSPGSSHYQVPPEPNRWPSIGLAVGVHALLLAFLVTGINWTNNQPVAVEAEVWDMSVQQAAPPPPKPQAEPEPEPEPERETPPPAPRVVEPPPKVEPAPPKQPDIAIEREKKRKDELKQRKEEERLERERERELVQQKRDQEKKEQEKKDKALAEKKEREDADKKALAKKEEAEQKKKAEKEKAAKEKAEKAKAEKAEAAKLEKARAEEMKRLTAGAGSPTSSGSAEKSTAPRIDKGYIASIAGKIKSNTTYPGSTDVPGNPEVVFQVEQLPTGEILSVRKTKSSGIPAFDDAVERGINKSSPLPKKKDGTVERSLPVSFKLKDLN